MATTPAQEEFLAITRKSQDAVIAAIKIWAETVKTTAPRLATVYAPLTGGLSRLPSFGVPFANRMAGPEETVARAYRLAEQLLAGQRKFTEDLLMAMTPLMPGRTESAPASPAAESTPASPAAKNAPAVTVAKEPARAEAKPAPKSAAARPARKSTASRTAPKTATAKSAPKTTTAKSTTAKSAPGTTTGEQAAAED